MLSHDVCTVNEVHFALRSVLYWQHSTVLYCSPSIRKIYRDWPDQRPWMHDAFTVGCLYWNSIGTDFIWLQYCTGLHCDFLL